MTAYAFRPLEISELDDAYAIIEEVTRWLLRKRVRQWLEPLPYELYRERQQRGDNFGLLIDGKLAAVVSLLDDRPAYWDDYLPETGFKWLTTLASSRRYKGQGLGQIVIEKAGQYLTHAGIDEIYLDCVYGEGILPQYYDLLGFDQLARKEIEFPHGILDSMLMRKLLGGTMAS